MLHISFCSCWQISCGKIYFGTPVALNTEQLTEIESLEQCLCWRNSIAARGWNPSPVEMHRTCARLQLLRTLLTTQPWSCFGLKPPCGSQPRNTRNFHTEEKCSAASKWAWKRFKLHQWNSCCRHSLRAKFGLCGRTLSGSETLISLSHGRAHALAAVTVYWMCSLLLLWTARAKFWCSQCDSFMQSVLINIFLRPGTVGIDNLFLSSF